MATDRDSVSTSKQDREKRLAEALRANLRRRKAAGATNRAADRNPGPPFDQGDATDRGNADDQDHAAGRGE